MYSCRRACMLINATYIIYTRISLGNEWKLHITSYLEVCVTAKFFYKKYYRTNLNLKFEDRILYGPSF
jgi:hypothetical protein